MILALQLILASFLLFVPIWAGGQAMTCYRQGNLWRSVAAVSIGVSLNFALLGIGTLCLTRYNFTIVTMLAALHL